MEPMCPICYEGIYPLDTDKKALVIVRQCGHMFHESCLMQWIYQPIPSQISSSISRQQQQLKRPSSYCPTCKTPCTMHDLQRIFGQWRMYPVCTEPCANSFCDNHQQAQHKEELVKNSARSVLYDVGNSGVVDTTSSGENSTESFMTSSTKSATSSQEASPPPSAVNKLVRSLAWPKWPYNSSHNTCNNNNKTAEALPTHVVESDMNHVTLHTVVRLSKRIIFNVKLEQKARTPLSVDVDTVKTRCRLIASRLRMELDELHNTPWQCFVRHDLQQHNFAASITHVSGYFAYFFVDDYSLVVFKTT